MTAFVLIFQKLMVVFVCATALFLAGCASSPPRPDNPVTDKQIVKAILNELYCTVKDPPLDDQSRNPDGLFKYDEDWVALIDLSLSTALEGSVSPEVTMVAPFNSAIDKVLGVTSGSSNLSIGASVDQTATTLRDNKFLIDINELLLKWPKTGIDCEHLIDSGRYLEGGLGLRPWLTRAIAANEWTRFTDDTTPYQDQARNQPSKAPVIITLGGTFTFAIKSSAHLGPLFMTDRLKGGSSSVLSLNRNDNNSVNIVLTPNCLFVNFPSPRGPQPSATINPTQRRQHLFSRRNLQPPATTGPTTSEQPKKQGSTACSLNTHSTKPVGARYSLPPSIPYVSDTENRLNAGLSKLQADAIINSLNR